MGNVRMTSLPADRAVASHGFKAIYLKWDQGIASRGKYAGRLTPAAKTKPAPGSRGHMHGHGHGRDRHQTRTPSVDREQDPVASFSSGVEKNRAMRRPQQTSTAAASPDPTTDRNVTNSFLSASMFRTLIHHFCSKAVSRLTWIDQPIHPWRTIVQRLLQHSTCVQLSVASLAAAHLSMTPGNSKGQRDSLYSTYCLLRDQALRILSRKMRVDLQARLPAAGQDQGRVMPATEILASMLALCYTEVFVPGSRDWKVHLQACRVVINLQQLEDWQKASRDPIFTFLHKEIVDLEILTSTTAFDEEAAAAAVRPLPTLSLQSASADCGWAFTPLIHELTLLERDRYSLQKVSSCLPSVDMDLWCRRIEQAYRGTMSSPRLTSCARSQALQQSFQDIARAHYYATLVYCYQVLAAQDAKTPDVVEGLVRCLFRDIQSIGAGPTDDLHHDLFFPLFIAGVESTSSRERQVVIDNLFVDSLSRTGIWCNYSALQFLRIFWAPTADLEYHGNWIHFARANLSAIGTFIVF
ncbi:hypothetical protein UVI_02019420 [Ustilaginoidea virens]|uniref:C6 transcription factor n=1 Tax=Ustilaginoidea virens TaxID=1159556 RepID=A0A1B5KZR0_USTVR|nr:hypothetical protein UVI_02019420 [Ustilaginoidea virens]